MSHGTNESYIRFIPGLDTDAATQVVDQRRVPINSLNAVILDNRGHFRIRLSSAVRTAYSHPSYVHRPPGDAAPRFIGPESLGTLASSHSASARTDGLDELLCNTRRYHSTPRPGHSPSLVSSVRGLASGGSTRRHRGGGYIETTLQRGVVVSSTSTSHWKRAAAAAQGLHNSRPPRSRSSSPRRWPSPASLSPPPTPLCLQTRLQRSAIDIAVCTFARAIPRRESTSNARREGSECCLALRRGSSRWIARRGRCDAAGGTAPPTPRVVGRRASRASSRVSRTAQMCLEPASARGGKAMTRPSDPQVSLTIILIDPYCFTRTSPAAGARIGRDGQHPAAALQ
ncbi:hypothetical protein AURDEDRAFT_165788 [Auricularia subglabra TFB-10046 SS5]|nr:hypothetical protein AURDEDRAFT_165788 [Auricularia subglabra TFB-10046 SS5]